MTQSTRIIALAAAVASLGMPGLGAEVQPRQHPLLPIMPPSKGSRWRRGDKRAAREHGIPQWLRRYGKRYGRDVESMILMRRRHPK